MGGAGRSEIMSKMDIMVVGGGGREHAIIKKLKESKNAGRIYCLPGNGGIAADCECVDIKATDIEGVVNFAKEHKVDFAVVAPDDPLVLGAVDELHKIGVKCFGPEKSAAIIEGSKVFSKNFMKRHGIPTARYEVFSRPEDALEYLKTAAFPSVVKADGLALGKGVLICEDYSAAEQAVKSIMSDKIFGDSGNNVVVEEFLTGPEVSVLCFCDGKTVRPMVSSMDHKRALDGDRGLNTGGMGTVAPNPYYTESIQKECMDKIFIPTVNGLAEEGRPFRGCLYFGLMLTPDGPKVIEYNCRFGDPETQVVLPLLKGDLLEIMLACEEGRLDEVPVEFMTGAAACVIIASGGYPKEYKKGIRIDLPQTDAVIYHSGTALKDGELVTAGGRVLGVTAAGADLKRALRSAYAAVEKISFDGAFYRKDIGQRALKAAAGKE